MLLIGVYCLDPLHHSLFPVHHYVSSFCHMFLVPWSQLYHRPRWSWVRDEALRPLKQNLLRCAIRHLTIAVTILTITHEHLLSSLKKGQGRDLLREGGACWPRVWFSDGMMQAIWAQVLKHLLCLMIEGWEMSGSDPTSVTRFPPSLSTMRVNGGNLPRSFILLSNFSNIHHHQWGQPGHPTLVKMV